MVKYFLLFPLFFPWFHFGLNKNDSQIYPGLISLIYLIISKKIIFPKFLPILIMALMMGLMLALPKSNFEINIIARSLYAYTSFFIILVATYTQIANKDIQSVTINANAIWLVGGLIGIISPDLIGVLNESRTSSGRGVTSFSPEPTYFAITLILFSLLIYINAEFNFKKNRIMHFLNVVTIVFLAKSTMGILYLAIGFAMLSISDSKSFDRIVKLFVVSVSGVILLNVVGDFLYETIFLDSRILKLAQNLSYDDVFYLITYDASINERVEHVYLSFVGAWKNYFIPHGIGTFGLYRAEYISPFEDVFWYAVDGSFNIMSWIGDWIFQLGIFGLFIVLVFAYYLCVYNSEKKIIVLYFFIILISAIPVAFPMIPIIIASLLYKKEKVEGD